MICPHCQKDTDMVYIDGHGMTREAAEEKHRRLMTQLDAMEEGGNLFQCSVKTERDKRWERLLAEAGKIEAALGY